MLGKGYIFTKLQMQFKGMHYLFILLFCFYGIGFSQNQDKNEIEAYIKKAHHIYRTNIDSALFYSNRAYELSLKYKDTLLIGKSIYYKSLCLIGKEKIKEAEDLLQFNITNKHLIDKNDLGDTYSILGAIYSQTNERDKAISLYFKAVETFTESNNNSGLAKTYLNIGVIYDKLDKKELADYFFEQSKFYSQNAKNSNKIHDLADTSKYNNSDLQIEMLLKALNSITHKEDSQLRAILYHALGSIYFEDKLDYENAILYLKKANKVKENIQYLNLLDLSYYLIGTSYVNLGNNNLGIENLNKSLAVTSNINLEKNIYERLLLAYNEEGDYKSAVEISRELGKIKDSINKHRENDRIAEITAQFETEKNKIKKPLH